MNSSNVTNEKSVLILYTGGTMGMQKIEDGSLAPVKGYLTEQISLLPHHPEMPQIIVKEYEEVLDSSSMGPREWAIIVNDIETNYLKYDGFVIIIGTDTMAYASSAVSFMLENIGKPVIFTGSTIPFSEVYSDARRNLLVSIIFASGTTFNEVCICFNDRLLRANRSCKVNSIGLTAFDSPNFPPLATMGAFIKENTELALAPPRGLFRTYKTIDSRVMVWRLLPGFDDSPLVAILGNGSDMRGVVLEMFGTGNGPPSARLLAAIKDAVTRGIVIVAVSQCLVGGVDLSMYEKGMSYKNVGVISGGDLTVEACVTKLGYLLARIQNNPGQVAHYMTVALKGEITTGPKTGYFHENSNSIVSKL